MQHLFLFIFVFLCTLLVGAYIFLYFFHLKLKKLEMRILELFTSRTNTVPALFKISKDFLTKHDDIFAESLRLRKREFSLYEWNPSILEIIEVEGKIHHEINFIFKVCNKHPKLLKNGNFIYLREIVIQRSQSIGKSVDLYKNMCQKFNTFIDIKNYSIIWIILPIRKKTII